MEEQSTISGTGQGEGKQRRRLMARLEQSLLEAQVIASGLVVAKPPQVRGLASLGQVSQASPMRSWSESAWLGLFRLGQLSKLPA